MRRHRIARLAVWIVLYSRRVFWWAIGATKESTLVLEALNRPLGLSQIEADQLLIHTDQGSQYGRRSTGSSWKEKGKISIISARGCCWYNTVV